MMALPCIPAYGGYNHYWLKAVRKQQGAFAALHLPETALKLQNVLPGHDPRTLQLRLALTGTNSASESSSAASLVVEALEIAAQEGLAAPQPVYSLKASMPRSKAEKQANKQAMNTISMQLDPSNIKLGPSTPDQHKKLPTKPADSPFASSSCTGVCSRPFQPPSLQKAIEQQLVDFSSTTSPLCDGKQLQPSLPQPPDQAAHNAVQERNGISCFSSQLPVMLEEPMFAAAPTSHAEAWPTAAAEERVNPTADSHQSFKDCTMLCPAGGLGNLWLEFHDEEPAPAFRDALYTKVAPLPGEAKQSSRPSAVLSPPNLDSILSSMFAFHNTSKHSQQQQPTATDAAALAKSRTAADQQGVIGDAGSSGSQLLAAAIDGGPGPAAVTAVTAHRCCNKNSNSGHQMTSRMCWDQLSYESQAGDLLLLEEPVLSLLQQPLQDTQQQQQQHHINHHKTDRHHRKEAGSSSTPSSAQLARLELVSMQQLLQFANAEVHQANAEDAAAGAADSSAAAGVSAEALDSKPWDQYVAIDFSNMEAAAADAAGLRTGPHQPMQVPAAVAASLLPTTGLLADHSIAPYTHDRQSHQQHAGCGAAELQQVLHKAVLRAAATSPRRRRASTRFAETPVCAPAAAAATSKTPAIAGAAASANVLRQQQELAASPAVQETAPLAQQQQLPSASATAMAHAQLTPAATTAAKTPLTAAVSAAMAASGTPAAALPRASIPPAAAADSQESDDGSQLLQLQLSPSEMMLEAPICYEEFKGPTLQESLLQDTLKLTKQLLDQPLAAVGDSCQQQQQQPMDWDASWGNLALAAAAGPAAASNPWWASQAVQDLIAGQYPATVDQQLAGQPGSNLPASPPAGKNVATGLNVSNLGSNLGAALLENMLARDMQLDSTGLLLPVMLFSEDVGMFSSSGGSSSSESDLVEQLVSGCCCRIESAAHLELYFDWSWLQPLPVGTSVVLVAKSMQDITSSTTAAAAAAAAAVGSKRARDSTGAFVSAEAGKRIRCANDAVVESSQRPHAAAAADARLGDCFDMIAWVKLVSKQPGLQQMQLFQELVQSVVCPAAKTDWQKLSWTWCTHAVQECMQQDAHRQQQQQESYNAGTAVTTTWGGDSGAAAEVASDMVTAAVAEWEQALTARRSAAAAAEEALVLQPAATAAVAAQAAVVDINSSEDKGCPAPASDMDFYMQLQNLAAAGKAGNRAAKRRLSIAQQQQQEGPSQPHAEEAAGLTAAAFAAAAEVAGTVSMSRKRLRVDHNDGQHKGVSGPGDLQCKDTVASADQHQHQQQTAADQAISGIPRAAANPAASGGPTTAAASGKQSQPLVVLQPPTLIDVQLPLPLLQVMLQLQANRKAVIASMQERDPQLLSCKLWDDLAVQKAVATFQKAATLQRSATLQEMAGNKEAAAVALQDQKQHARKLGALLILAQTAGCLLHYGVRVAHLFLQHSLHKLPSVAAACAKSAAALATAYEAVEKRPPTAAAGVGKGGSSSSGSSALAIQEDHPKLGKLKGLLTDLQVSKPGSKVLLVAETKAFFSLYQPISAAGLSAVQLDRNRKLIQSSPAAAGCDQTAAAAAAAGGASAEEWEAAAAAALASGRCVLITHEHLMHPSMPIHMFDALVEYVAAAETAAAAGKATAGKSNNSDDAWKDEVVAKFSGCHYVFKVLPPDLQRAAADITAAQAAAAKQVPAAEACSEVWPATAAPAAAYRARPSTAVPDAAVHPASAGQPELTAAGSKGPQAELTTAANPEQPAAGLRGREYPLVLNRSPGSLLRQRRSLYEAMLQLEEQGYLLVERNLGSGQSTSVSNVASAAGAGGLCSSAGAAAVDIVVSPVACLCVWGETKLPQDPAAVMPVLSKTLLQLSMAYEAVHYIFELPDSLLQLVVKHLAGLQQVAAAARVKLQAMCSFTAANTQDYILAICRSAAASFWSSSSSNSQIKPPSISDIPTPQEAFLNSCSALTPLSAAVLANKGLSLRNVFGALVTAQSDQADQQSQQWLSQVSVGIPARCLRLLAAQVTALHLNLEGDSPGVPECGAKRKQINHHQQQQDKQLTEQHLQQQHSADNVIHDQQHMQPGLPAWQQEDQLLQHPQYEQQQQHASARLQWQQQQMPYQAQQQYDVPGDEHGYQNEDYSQPLTAYCAAQQQHPHEQQGLEVQDHHYQPQQQQQQHQEPAMSMDIDPAGVLDAFLYTRRQQRTNAAADAGRPGRMGPPHHRPAQQQQHYQHRSMQHTDSPHSHAAHLQQQQQPGFANDDLPDINMPFAVDLDTNMPEDLGTYHQQQQQRLPVWHQEPHMQQDNYDNGYSIVEPMLGLQDMFGVQRNAGNMVRQRGHVKAAAAAASGYYEQQEPDAAGFLASADDGMYAEPDLVLDKMHQQFGGIRHTSSRKPTENMFQRAATATAGNAGAGKNRIAVPSRPVAARLGSANQMFNSDDLGMHGQTDSGVLTTAALGGARPGERLGQGGGMTDVLFGAAKQGYANIPPRRQAQMGGMFVSAALGMGGAHAEVAEGHLDTDSNQQLDTGWDGELSLGLESDNAAAADNRGFQQGLIQRAGRAVAGGASQQLVRPTASASTSRSSLFAEAFMPHRNPTKQLKYKKGAGRVIRGKGKQQSKLYWG